MNDLGVIDRFTNVFAQYIDSGFGLLSDEIAFLTATLIAIDMTLAGVFWVMGGDDVLAKLLRKTLYVGAFSFIISNFHTLAGLGLTATDSTLTAADLLRPGRLAAVGVDAARPIMEQIGQLTGFPDIFSNLDSVAILFLAWLVVIVSFFILAVQLFVTIIEFKLTTLAGFVLVPFALWNKTAFLAERVLGNVVSSGIKILVLAVIAGIGAGLFDEFIAAANAEFTIDNALAIMLASLALLGIGLFGPSIATGLVSGAPQLGAGAAAGTTLAVGGLAVAGGVAATGTGQLAGALGGSALRASGSALRAAAPAIRSAGGAAAAGYSAFRTGMYASGASGSGAVASGLANVARAGGKAAARGIQSTAARAHQALRQKFGFSDQASTATKAASAPSAAASTTHDTTAPPKWARSPQQRQPISHGVATAAHVVRSTDHPSSGANPSLREGD